MMIDRRDLLQAAAAALAAGATSVPAVAGTPSGKVTGKGPGDFDFLTGEWTIANRRLKDGTTDVWEEFAGGATVHRVLGGQASIEELRARGNFLGMGVRVWHPAEKLWADHWTGVHNGVVNEPQMGQFIDGAGVFLSDETVDGVAWQYRGLWDRIGDGACRWTQASSKDGGKTWAYNWYMDWTRIGG